MVCPHALLLVLLVAGVAGASAGTPAANGTCPADSPKVCEENCCNSKQRCALRRRPTQTSKYECEPYSLIIAAVICAVAASLFAMYVIRRHNNGKNRLEEETTEATPADSEAAATAESEADNLPPPDAPAAAHHGKHGSRQ